MRSVANGQAKIDPELASRVLSEFKSYQKAEVAEVYQPLTPREQEILQLMSEGLPNKTIATRLSISERTVTTHVANIYTKLQVNNRVLRHPRSHAEADPRPRYLGRRTRWRAPTTSPLGSVNSHR